MAEKQTFYENGCNNCQFHMEYGMSRYCAGFKNKSRRKPFRKSDPTYKAPKWCPKRKSPSEYRIYGFKDENSEMMFLLLSEAIGNHSYVSVCEYRYCLRASGTVSMTVKEFYKNANDPQTEYLFPQEVIETGEVVEIDTGLSVYCFYCAGKHDFRRTRFDPNRMRALEEKENGG